MVLTKRLRRYAEDKQHAKRSVERVQQDLIDFVAERLVDRFRRQTALSDLSLVEWLLACGRLESTYSSRAFSYDTRTFWAQRSVNEAVDLTLGTFDKIGWFLDGLEKKLGVQGRVSVDIDTIQHGAHKDKWTIAFRPAPSVEPVE